MGRVRGAGPGEKDMMIFAEDKTDPATGGIVVFVLPSHLGLDALGDSRGVGLSMMKGCFLLSLSPLMCNGDAGFRNKREQAQKCAADP